MIQNYMIALLPYGYDGAENGEHIKVQLGWLSAHL